MTRSLSALLVLPLLAGCSAETLNAVASAAANAQRPTYTRGFVATVTINRMPFTNARGVAWDMGSAPDPVAVLVDATTNQAVWTGQAVQDVAPGRLPLAWRVNYEVPLGKSYKVMVFDDDLTGRELIFTSQPFTAQQVMQAGQTAYTIADQAGTINAVVGFTWAN